MSYKSEVLRVSALFGLDPYDLDAIINSESGRNKDAKNPQPGQTAYGYFQMIEANRKQFLGTKNLPLSQKQQFDLFIKYAKHWKLKQNATGGQIYAILFVPALANNYTLATKGEEYYTRNVGLDKNNDGKIDMKDLQKQVNKKKDGKIDFGIYGEILKFRNHLFNQLF